MIRLLGKVLSAVLIMRVLTYAVKGGIELTKIVSSVVKRCLNVKKDLKVGEKVEINGEYYEVVHAVKET